MSLPGRVRAGAQRATRHFPSPGRGAGSHRRKESGFLLFMENGLFPISFLATTSAAPDTERQDDFLKLVFFFPFSLFSPVYSAAFLLSPPRRRVRRLTQLCLVAGRGPTSGRQCVLGRGPAAAMHAAEPPLPEDSGTTLRPNF